MLKETFKRKVIDLSAVDPFYKAAFTTQISRVRFNRELAEKRRHAHTGLGLLALYLMGLVI